MNKSPWFPLLLLLLLLYVTSDILVMYVLHMLPWFQVITLSDMYVQPLEQITYRPGDTFLNLHPENYGIYICIVNVPRKVMCWQRDVGKTLLIQNGPYCGAQFSINVGVMHRYSITPEFVPIATGEPKAWLSTLLQDLKLISSLPQAKTTQLSTVIQHLASSTSSDPLSDNSLIVTTTGKRYLTVDDIDEIKQIWTLIKQAMQITYEMTGITT
jgi:hypothetical protein